VLQRILPAYEAFSRDDRWGDARPLRAALDRVWHPLVGERLDQKEACGLVKRCEPQIHHLDDPFESVFAAPGHSSAIALLRTVECAVDGDLELAARVSDVALDAFEVYVDTAERGRDLRRRTGDVEPPLPGGDCPPTRTPRDARGARKLDRGPVERLRRQSQRAGFAAIVESRR